VSPITTESRDYRSEEPLHPKAQELLSEYFAEGWVDPSKMHHQSRRLAILFNQARDEIAANLGVFPDEVEFVGELGFGFWSAIAGVLQNSPSRFIHSTIDRQVIHAFARTLKSSEKIVELAPDQNGRIDFNRSKPDVSDFLVWQGVNREIGVAQDPLDAKFNPILFADMTAATPFNPLPPKWDLALFDPRSFRGPSGISILTISRKGRWTSPLPPMDKRRVFGSFSIPLALATAVSLNEAVKAQDHDRGKIAELNQFIRKELRDAITGLHMTDPNSKDDPRYVAIGIQGVVAEKLLQRMENFGFLIDAGSACGAGALSPSHVLDALGWGNLAHVRLTLKANQSQEDVKNVVTALSQAVSAER